VFAWLTFFLWFLAYAFSQHGAFLFIDTPNMVVHEGGHALFGWFGETLGLWGGTILQWLVPLLLAIYFFHQRQAAGFVFCLFFFFENWIYTATYMADARAMELRWSHWATPNLPNTTGIRSSPISAYCNTTLSSPASCDSWAGAECWPAPHGWRTFYGSLSRNRVPKSQTKKAFNRRDR
jgi:hypothetical protein